MNADLIARSRLLADNFLTFVNYARSPFHAIDWCKKELLKNGFNELREDNNWVLASGHKYFFTRNKSTLIAFAVGSNYHPDTNGFKIIGAHSDSPCLRLQPVSKGDYKTVKQCMVSTYGGGLWHTWFDRDLSLAGKVIHKRGDTITSTLWQSSHPLLKIPNLAIHLRGNKDNFQPNTENQLRPIFYSSVSTPENESAPQKQPSIYGKHHAQLVDLIAGEIGVKTEDLIDIDLCLADSQLSSYVGLNEDFISSPRIDNLFSSYHAIRAILECSNAGKYVSVAALFDHEECGSDSSHGAGSNILFQALNRLHHDLGGNSFEAAMHRSFLVSADMAHSVHPNYSDKHQVNHMVEMNKGIVIKINNNQRYATDLESSAIFKTIAQRANVPIQQFVVKNNSPCGSTIGPILTSNTGIKGIDIGAPMLGMHSIRETCGVIDGAYYNDLFKAFYDHYEDIKHDLFQA